MLFQIRDDDPAVIARLEESVAKHGRRGHRARPLRRRDRAHSYRRARVDGRRFQKAIEAASAAFAGGRSIRMPSGAGHDAQVLATIMPAGMLFVPSIGGISHHWTENTADADIVTGAEVFVDACRRLLAG